MKLVQDCKEPQGSRSLQMPLKGCSAGPRIAFIEIMGLRFKLLAVLCFLSAMLLSAIKVGWVGLIEEPQVVNVDLFQEMQSLWEVEHINQAEPFKYHEQFN